MTECTLGAVEGKAARQLRKVTIIFNVPFCRLPGWLWVCLDPCHLFICFMSEDLPGSGINPEGDTDMLWSFWISLPSAPKLFPPFLLPAPLLPWTTYDPSSLTPYLLQCQLALSLVLLCCPPQPLDEVPQDARNQGIGVRVQSMGLCLSCLILVHTNTHIHTGGMVIRTTETLHTKGALCTNNILLSQHVW